MEPFAITGRFRNRVTSARAVVALLGIAAGCALGAPTLALPQGVDQIEAEPNDSAATANALNSGDVRVTGNLDPGGDVDFFAFQANAGDSIHAAVMTSGSGSGTDSELTLLAPDGTSVIELDSDDGSLSGLSSSIAGATIPTTGTYYLRLRYPASLTSLITPYALYVQVKRGSPTAEIESNDTYPGLSLPASGWVSGVVSTSADSDFYSMTLGAGDTVFLSLDLDPERDGGWNGRLGIGTLGSPASILVVDDANAVSPNSEALFMTVKSAGTYAAYVGAAPGVTNTGSYRLSVNAIPTAPASMSVTSSDGPKAIPSGPSIVTSTLTVPGNPSIAKLRLTLNLTHTLMQNLDVMLTSPSGNSVVVFTDIGSGVAGTQTTMDATFDDDAAIPPAFSVVQGLVLRPESRNRLHWFTGQPAGGIWTLTVADDTAANDGRLLGWSLDIISETVPSGPIITLFSTDFEGDMAGFTHSGTADEWQYGTPSFAGVAGSGGAAAFNGCNSGTSCWKTDLDDTYDPSSDQTLLSPPITLTGITAGAVYLEWAMRYQLELVAFDRFSVTVNEVGNPANAVSAYRYTDPTMSDSFGNPIVTVHESAGWGKHRADISKLMGKVVEVRFNLSSDTTIQFAGLGIDDVAVRRYLAQPREYVPNARRSSPSAW